MISKHTKTKRFTFFLSSNNLKIIIERVLCIISTSSVLLDGLAVEARHDHWRKVWTLCTIIVSIGDEICCNGDRFHLALLHQRQLAKRFQHTYQYCRSFARTREVLHHEISLWSRSQALSHINSPSASSNSANILRFSWSVCHQTNKRGMQLRMITESTSPSVDWL